LERLTEKIRPGYRQDIDGLRAIAIVLVVAYHVFPAYLPGGFIGVDVFFVISGYLITGIVLGQRGGLTAKLGEFYAHRIRRIFPALIVVLTAVLAGGAALLLPDEMVHLKQDALASALFVANIRFWKDAGYFDVLAPLKPLLHLWSLGVEEQFYLVWPWVIWLLAMRSRAAVMVGIALIAAISFALNFTLVDAHPIGVFYLLPTRMWELCIGAALVGFDQLSRMPKPARGLLALTGLAAILSAAAFYSAGVAVPGSFALLPTLGAAAIIAAGKNSFIGMRILGNPAAAYLGRVSYPLYLWHWPLLSFVQIISFHEAHWPLRLTVVVAAILLAILTYELVEKPLRARKARRLAGALLGAMACVAVVSLLLPTTLARGTDALALLWPYGGEQPAPQCERSFPWMNKQGLWFCEANSDAPANLLILGDSHADELYPGMVAALPGWSILSIGTCEPDDIRLRAGVFGGGACAGDRPLEQSRFVHDLIRRQQHIHYAILSAEWPAFTAKGEKADPWSGKQASPAFDLVVPDSRFPHPSQRDAYFVGLNRRVDFLESHGIKIILSLATPMLPYDVRRCLSRPFRQASENCTFSRNEWTISQASFVSIAKDLKRKHPTLTIIDPVGLFCRQDKCSVISKGNIYLRDDNHLSVDGSLLVASAFKVPLKGE
jgi:peptidoglycan/LPS O-acetylase OafA/YrhL